MAIEDIPEYVAVSPGDLIRSEDWNQIQRRARNSVRVHRHTRVDGAPVDDATTEDHALQIATDEIADGAVTSAKLAPGVTDIPDGSVTPAKLAPGIGLRGWLRMPFYPLPAGTAPAFSLFIAATSTATGATGVMGIPVPPEATVVTRFRIAGFQNAGTINVNLVRLDNVNGSIEIMVQNSINGAPFDDISTVTANQSLGEGHSVFLLVQADNASSIGFVAVEFE